MKKFDVASLRLQFPMLQRKMHGKPLIYFDSAATALKPKSVIDAIANFYQHQYGTVHRAIYDLSAVSTQMYEQTREKVRQFLNAANSTEIIFTKGTTDAINLVAHSFGKAFIKAGDEIIISEMEHHSNIVPWQILCENTGAILRIIPVCDRATLQIDKFRNLLNSRTKLVSISHVANATGTVNPIEQIIKMAHALGAKVMIDGAQAVQHIPVDVQGLDVDFYAFSGHKLYGPTGIGVLYGKEDLLNKMPPYQGGGDMIEHVTLEKTTYNRLPLKFEAGTPPIAQVSGLGAAIDYLNEIGLTHIAQWEHELYTYAEEKIRNIPKVRLIGDAPNKSSIITFVIEGVHPLDVGTLLDMQGIAIRTGHLCAQPTMQRFGITSACRVSLAFYNTKEEVDYFIKSLQNAILQLQPLL